MVGMQEPLGIFRLPMNAAITLTRPTPDHAEPRSAFGSIQSVMSLDEGIHGYKSRNDKKRQGEKKCEIDDVRPARKPW